MPIVKTVTLYYANWCPHCKNVVPEWDRFKQIYDKNSRQIESKYNTKLDIKKYEDKDIPPGTNVAGFPTIMIVYNDKQEEYIGNKNTEDFFKKLINRASDDDIRQWVGVFGGKQMVDYGAKLAKYKKKFATICE